MRQLPDAARYRRFYTLHGRVSFVCLVLAVTGVCVSLGAEGSARPFLIVVNCATAAAQTYNVLKARHALRVQAEWEAAEARLAALVARLARTDMTRDS